MVCSATSNDFFHPDNSILEILEPKYATESVLKALASLSSTESDSKSDDATLVTHLLDYSITISQQNDVNLNAVACKIFCDFFENPKSDLVKKHFAGRFTVWPSFEETFKAAEQEVPTDDPLISRCQRKIQKIQTQFELYLKHADSLSPNEKEKSLNELERIIQVSVQPHMKVEIPFVDSLERVSSLEKEDIEKFVTHFSFNKLKELGKPNIGAELGEEEQKKLYGQLTSLEGNTKASEYFENQEAILRGMFLHIIFLFDSYATWLEKKPKDCEDIMDDTDSQIMVLLDKIIHHIDGIHDELSDLKTPKTVYQKPVSNEKVWRDFGEEALLKNPESDDPFLEGIAIFNPNSEFFYQNKKRFNEFEALVHWYIKQCLKHPFPVGQLVHLQVIRDYVEHERLRI